MGWPVGARLQHGVEPREDEQQLRARHRPLLDVVLMHERLVCALQVLLHTGRRLERDLERLR